jgi:hypothetical protein
LRDWKIGRPNNQNSYVEKQLDCLQDVDTMASSSSKDSLGQVTIILDGIFVGVQLEVHVPKLHSSIESDHPEEEK